VQTRKEAKLVFYRLGSDQIAALADALAKLSARDAGAAPPPRRRAPGAANFARLT
jgi:hypothetical protein